MKIFYLISIILIISLKNASASTYEKNLTSCLLKNTGERDKIILARWMFVAIAEHDSIKNDFGISERKKISSIRSAAEYLQFVLGDKCLSETRAAIKNDNQGFLKAFEKLGEVAILELMENKSVNVALEEWLKYVDNDFLKKFE